MKINREARQASKKLFNACFQNGNLDEARLRQVVKALAEQKPRHYLAILSRIKKLAELEIDRRTYSIESSVPLPDSGAALFEQLRSRFGPALVTRYETNPSLLGGLRIQVGSDVWDGSIRARLNALEQKLN